MKDNLGKSANRASDSNLSLGYRISELFIALSSNNVGKQVTFYRTLLQTQPKVTTSRYAEFCLTGLKIAIFQPSADNASEFAAASSGSMSFCLEVNDIESAIAHLKTLGYPLSNEIMHTSHGKEIYAYDPDGNRLILHQQC